MRDTFLFAAQDKVRNKLINEAAGCPVEKRTVVPEGFNNNILWHLGHVYTVTDSLLFGVSGVGRKAPESYRSLFGNGTKPADWPADVPSWDTIVAQLQEQAADIRATFDGKLGDGVGDNFAKAETIGEMLAFSLNHENGHAGNVNSMLKVLKR